MKNIAKHLLCMVLMLVLPVSVQAARGYCMVCEGSYSYTEEYTEWTDEEHNVRHWCDNCGEDQYGGVLAEEHNFEHYSSRYDRCEDCGYRIDCEHICDHDITYTEWDDCDWYEYCVECDELVDEGTEHGDYEYDDWEYYSSSRHRRYYYCENCGGDDGYDYGYHDEETEYYEYDEDQHEVVEYCADCDTYITEDYEDHDFSYGSWKNYSGTQHRRSVYCYDCGYSSYEYTSHSLIYGAWTSAGSSQHQRTVSCSCGYSTTEYASHSLTNGSWTSTGSSQHKRTVSCSCGYSTTETKSHYLTYGAWTKYSGTRHKRTVSCSDCSYSTTEYVDHSLSYSDWESYDELEHCRDASCSTCGYSTVEYADHTLTAGDWKEYSDTQHSRTVACSCGYNITEYGDHADTDNDGYCDGCGYLMTRFSVTLPTVMLIVVAEDGWVYTASNAEIVNNSTHSVEITSVTITAGDNWTLVPYGWNMADEKVDSRLIGFYLNGAESSRTGGSEILTLPDIWTIDKDDSFVLEYDAVVSATSDVLKNEQVLTLVFVVDWLYL